MWMPATAPLLAADRSATRDSRTAVGHDYGMQVMTNLATPGATGHGWRHFSDSATRRAVVISPLGQYYFSQGQGLRWVASTMREA